MGKLHRLKRRVELKCSLSRTHIEQTHGAFHVFCPELGMIGKGEVKSLPYVFSRKEMGN